MKKRMKTILTKISKLVGGDSIPSKQRSAKPSKLSEQRSAKPSKLSKHGFTLIELLVVIAMLAILLGAVGSSVSQSRRRAKIARATQDAKEITNAILGFQQYAKGRTLVPYATGGWKDATESALKMILGGETSESGDQVPVLYNAHLTGENILDPWGNVYRFQIKQLSGESEEGTSATYLRAANLPNYYRLTDEERQ